MNLLILSHGQATGEKGFSINRLIVVDNMKEASFIAQRSIHDHILHIRVIDALVVSKALLVLLRVAANTTSNTLGEQKCNAAKMKSGTERHAVVDESSGFERKAKLLNTIIESLQDDADKLAEKVESTGNLVFLMKSNASRRSAREMEAGIGELAKTAKDLEQKSKDV